MYIVYHDERGAHTSIVAAALHLGQLPMDSMVNKEDIKKLPHFNRVEKIYLGKLVFHGKDKYNNEVYTLGRKKAGPLVSNTLESITHMVEKNKQEILCVDTSRFYNLGMSLGGILSISLGLRSLGDPLACMGALKSFSKLQQMVKMTKLKIAP